MFVTFFHGLKQAGVPVTLREYLTLPASYRAALISRVKIMASLDISEKRRAQDGKILFQNFGPAKLELRLSDAAYAKPYYWAPFVTYTRGGARR